MNQSITTAEAICLQFDQDNITLNCAGYNLTSISGSNIGTYLNGHTAIMLDNCSVYNFDIGIRGPSTNSIIRNSYFEGYSFAIFMEGSNYTLENDTVVGLSGASYSIGLYVSTSASNSYVRNSIIKKYGTTVYGAIYHETNGGQGVNYTNVSVTSVDTGILFGSNSYNNFFTGGIINATTWITDNSGGTNYFNDSLIGNNYIFSNGTAAWEVCNISDNDSNNYADIGSDLPFTSSVACLNSYWSGSDVDYHPYTETTTIPSISWQNPTPTNNTNNFTYGITFNCSSDQTISNASYIEVDGVNKTCSVSEDNLSCSYALPYAEHLFNNSYDAVCYLNVSGTYYNGSVRSFDYYGCGVVNASGTMMGNAGSTTTLCFTINVSNIFFNGAEYNITTTTGLASYGVYLNDVENDTIMNISSSTTGADAYGIYLLNCRHNTVSSIVSLTTGLSSYGIYYTNGTNNTMTNIVSNTSGEDAYAFYLMNSSGDYLQNITAYSNGTNSYGMYIHNSNGDTINGGDASVISGENGYGIYFSSGGNNTISNLKINTYGLSAHGFFLTNGTNNTITNTTATTSGETAYGIHLLNSTGGRLIDTIVNASTVEGFSIGLIVEDTTYYSMTGVISSTFGDFANAIYLSGSEYNNVSNSNFATIGTGGNTIGLYNSNNNIFKNNTLISGAGTEDLLSLGATCSNNIFFDNNFTETTGSYVYDMNGTNIYNTTEGNVYYNVMNGSVNITGTSPSTGYPLLYIGTDGTDYPYDNTTGKFSCNFPGCADYLPLTDQLSGTTTTSTTSTTTTSTTTTSTTLSPYCNNIYVITCDLYDGNETGCNSSYTNYDGFDQDCIYNETSMLCNPGGIQCTPTTTTTTSSSTTTTTPGTLPANSILWIFTILTPILATVFTLCTLCCIGKGILPSIFASTLWYASSMWTTRIRFVDNFTVSMSTYYVDVGNWEVGTLYLAFAAIMAIYTMVLVLDYIYSSNKQNG